MVQSAKFKFPQKQQLYMFDIRTVTAIWSQTWMIDRLVWPLATPSIGWLSSSKWPSVMVALFLSKVLAVGRIVKCRGKQWCWLLGTQGRVRAPTLYSLSAFTPRRTAAGQEQCTSSTCNSRSQALAEIRKTYSYRSNWDQMHGRIWCELLGWWSSTLPAY